MSDLAVFRRPVRNLARLVAAREGAHSPCWLIRTHDNCALIVPSLTARMEYLRTFKRATVDEAEVLGLIVLGGRMEDVPPFTGAPRWLVDLGASMGRTVSVRGGVR